MTRDNVDALLDDTEHAIQSALIDAAAETRIALQLQNAFNLLPSQDNPFSGIGSGVRDYGSTLQDGLRKLKCLREALTAMPDPLSAAYPVFLQQSAAWNPLVSSSHRITFDHARPLLEPAISAAAQIAHDKRTFPTLSFQTPMRISVSTSLGTPYLALDNRIVQDGSRISPGTHAVALLCKDANELLIPVHPSFADTTSTLSIQSDTCNANFVFAALPDHDNDGVPDDEDMCPRQAGEPNLHGCAPACPSGVSDPAAQSVMTWNHATQRCDCPSGFRFSAVAGICECDPATGGPECGRTRKAGESCTPTQQCDPASACFHGYCVGTGALRVSLAFQSSSDIDLHLVTPTGREIFYNSRTADGGELDVDQCKDICVSNTLHVESIKFANAPPAGHYRVIVSNYLPRESAPVSFEVDVAGAAVTSRAGSLQQVVGNQASFEFDIPPEAPQVR